jgi:hypothetical protein
VRGAVHSERFAREADSADPFSSAGHAELARATSSSSQSKGMNLHTRLPKRKFSINHKYFPRQTCECELHSSQGCCETVPEATRLFLPF